MDNCQSDICPGNISPGDISPTLFDTEIALDHKVVIFSVRAFLPPGWPPDHMDVRYG